MSYSARAFDLLRQGYSEAEAYAIVAAERQAELSVRCPPSERQGGSVIGHGGPLDPAEVPAARGDGSIEGGVDTRGRHDLKSGPSNPTARTEAPNDLDSQTSPDPDCRFCHGTGTYYEDVTGDGGSRMAMDCECWVSDTELEASGQLSLAPDVCVEDAA